MAEKVNGRGDYMQIDSSLHRGSNAFKWLKAQIDHYDEETAIKDIAHELHRSLQLNGNSEVILPPNFPVSDRDRMLVNEIRKSLSDNTCDTKPPNLYVVAFELHLFNAGIIYKDLMMDQNGGKLTRIGCGSLIVPVELTSEDLSFTDFSWQHYLKQQREYQRFVPLVRCQTVVC